VKSKLDSVEENYAIGKIADEIFNKYSIKYKEEIVKIEKEIVRVSFGTSNLEKCLKYVVDFCVKPYEWWEKASIGSRTILQNILFPDGIIYNRQNDTIGE
jgi:hypothetical protein